MKPLLRVVLIVDALFLLAFGVLFLLTPWTSLYDALQLVRPQPTLVGQAFGFVLIGLAWLAAHAAFEGALTAPIGKIVGHVNWIVGVLMLVWLIGLHTPPMSGFGELVAGALGAWMIVLGLGGVRLSRTVRRRDRALALETAAAAKAAERREPASFAGPANPANAREPRVVATTGPAQPGADVTAATHAAAAPAPSPGDATAARDEAAGATRPPLHG